MGLRPWGVRALGELGGCGLHFQLLGLEPGLPAGLRLSTERLGAARCGD